MLSQQIQSLAGPAILDSPEHLYEKISGRIGAIFAQINQRRCDMQRRARKAGSCALSNHEETGQRSSLPRRQRAHLCGF